MAPCDFTFGMRHAVQYDCRPSNHFGFGDQVFGAGSGHFVGRCLFCDPSPIFYHHLEMLFFLFSFGLGRTLFRRYQV
jgi:hypothetical protein